MNKKKLLAFLVSSAFLFVGCNEDDPISPNNNETEISSSSEEDDCDSDECEVKSSSSKTEDKKSSDSKDDDKKSSDSKDNKSSDSKSESNSSSSAKDEAKSSSSAETPKSSSSVEVPAGAHAAKLTDLEKNYELKIFDQTVYLSTGSKQGLIALRIPDELWVVTYTDFANGVVKFNKDNVGIQYSDTDAAKAVKNKLDAGFKLSFIVDKDGKVKYAVGDSKEYSEAVSTKVSLQSGKVSKAADIQNKIFECTDGDTTRTFTFFDNSYIVENAASGKVAYWIGGHYDIQRSTLLMRPAYYNKPVYSMYAYSVGSDNSISSSNGETTTTMNCKVEASEYEYEKASDFVGEWQALVDGIEWEFSLKADGTYELDGFEGTKNVESKTGVWEIYGNQLMMRNKGCLHRESCTTSIHGAAEVKSNGFEYKHSDPDTPKIPTSFEATQYE
ncbi:hypothetical protein [Fibrobacter sp.]|uniref:hypothetical protein n=1 Tax=Fibrobacter sp. TaxID=35828 RepID=UPI00386A00D5